MAKVKGKKGQKTKRCHCVIKSHKGYCNENAQCPHLHFKSDVVNRDELSKNQYLDLLCTPRGYRWEPNEGEGEYEEENDEQPPYRRIICQGRRARKPERAYVHNFLAEVWTLLTPEMITRLKEMLQNEFKMSPEEALEFIQVKREDDIEKSSTVSLIKKRRKLRDGTVVLDSVIKKRKGSAAECDKFTKAKLGIRNTWVKKFSDKLSQKLSTYVIETMSAERSERQQGIAEALLERFNGFLEQNAKMDNPQTKVQKAMVVAADRLSLWLDKNVKISKEVTNRIRELGLEEERKKFMVEMKKREEEDREKAERKKHGKSDESEGEMGAQSEDGPGESPKPDDGSGEPSKPDEYEGSPKPDDESGGPLKPDDESGGPPKPDDVSGGPPKPDDESGGPPKPDSGPGAPPPNGGPERPSSDGGPGAPSPDGGPGGPSPDGRAGGQLPDGGPEASSPDGQSGAPTGPDDTPPGIYPGESQDGNLERRRSGELDRGPAEGGRVTEGGRVERLEQPGSEHPQNSDLMSVGGEQNQVTMGATQEGVNTSGPKIIMKARDFELTEASNEQPQLGQDEELKKVGSMQEEMMKTGDPQFKEKPQLGEETIQDPNRGTVNAEGKSTANESKLQDLQAKEPLYEGPFSDVPKEGDSNEQLLSKINILVSQEAIAKKMEEQRELDRVASKGPRVPELNRLAETYDDVSYGFSRTPSPDLDGVQTEEGQPDAAGKEGKIEGATYATNIADLKDISEIKASVSETLGYKSWGMTPSAKREHTLSGGEVGKSGGVEVALDAARGVSPEAAKVLTVIATKIVETAEKGTPRQEAIKVIMEKKLEEELGSEDRQTIQEIAGKIGTWMDELVDQVGAEYGDRRPTHDVEDADASVRQAGASVLNAGAPTPVSQKPKGPIYKLRRLQSEPIYAVETISHTQATREVRIARGMSPHRVINPETPMDKEDMEEFAEWADTVSGVAQEWAKWVENVSHEATVKSRSTNVKATNPSRWESFKKQKEEESSGWSFKKRQIEKEADVWKRKTAATEKVSANRTTGKPPLSASAS